MGNRFAWSDDEVGFEGERTPSKKALPVVHLGFDPSEPRDQDGRWTTGGGAHKPPAKPAEQEKPKRPDDTSLSSQEQSEAVYPHLKASAQKWWDGLSQTERSAIDNYGMNGWAYNEFLRHLEGKRPSDLKDLQSAMDLARLPKTTEEFSVYRGLDAEMLNTMSQKGSEFSDRGFVSTSLSPAAASMYGKLVARIRVPVGTKGAHISTPLQTIENEFLLPKNTTFRRTGEVSKMTVDNSGHEVTVVDLEVVKP